MNDLTVHDHAALRAMLAKHAADDTNWDHPPMLFALIHDPVAGYGIGPLRPWNDVFQKALMDHPPQVVLPAMADMARNHLDMVPGLNSGLAAVDVCLHVEAVRRRWFPGITEAAVPCGIVYRTEVWGAPMRDGKIPERFTVSQDPERMEVLMWQAVSDDDTFHQVAWKRGDAAPVFDSFAFDSPSYRPKERMIAKHLRRLMRINRYADGYNFETETYERKY